MSGNLALIVGGALGSLGIGYAIGRTVKTIRQFFDHI